MKSPAWDIESEYPSIESKEFAADEQAFIAMTEELRATISRLDFEKPSKDLVPTLQTCLETMERAGILVWNLHSYVGCIQSVDASDAGARKKFSEIMKSWSSFTQATKPIELFLKRCDVEIFDAVFVKPEIKGQEFSARRARERSAFLLSQREEVLLSAMENPGHHAWSTLRENLVGTAKVDLKYPDRVERVGLADAASRVYGDDPVARKVAWTAIQEFWTANREIGASILNALASWRLEVYEKRSHTKPLHFLDEAVFGSRITRETLDAIIETCRKNLPQLRRAPLLMAKTMGRQKMEPWDLQGTSPIKGSKETLDFDRGLEIVKKGYATADPEMANFAQMMADKRWIEARILPNKGAGAHCTGFSKSRTPRVFQTYTGSLSDVMTLAHEIGHAYHSWVMRDLPIGETDYPMTLAETASVFGETVVADTLIKSARSW
ncbi:MAG: M3 family metallopeptidase, partial [Bdellovibrionota bacterium]